MSEFLENLPVSTRTKVYNALIAVGTVLGAVNVGFLAATGDIPLWLAVTNAVALFLGIPTGKVAKNHIKP